MKSILQAMFGKLSSFFSVEKTSTSENILGTDSELFEKSGSNNFMVAYLSTLMNSIFGFFQKNPASLFGLKKLSQGHRFKVNALGVLTLVLFFGMNVINGQVSFNGSTYNQDFQTIPATAFTPASIANTTMLQLSSQTGGGPSGWYMYYVAGTPRYGRTNGSSNTGSIFGMYDAQTTPDRAFGAQGSASASAFFGTVIQNTSGSTITSVTISYDAVMNRNPSTTVNSYPMSYRVSSTNIVTTSSTADGTYNNSAGTWTAGTGFSTPSSGTGSPTTTQVVYSPLLKIGSTITQTLTGLSWGNNQYLYIRWLETDESGADSTAGIDNFSISVPSSATITGAATATAFTTTYGVASAVQTFAISGSGLTANITATAPTGFEVSSDGTNYNTTATFTQSGGNASGSLRIRLTANAAVSGSYNSQNIVLSSTGATNVNITTAASGNSVTPAALTITGVNSTNKVYNASAIGSLTGSASYSGLQNSESFSVTGTPVATFAQATVGTGIAVTVIGYTAPSTNYTVSQPTVANADITTKPLTISGLSGVNKLFDGNDTATLSGTASLVGVIPADNSNVTLGGTPVATFASSAVGTGIAITVTGYSISGSASGNYSLSQPTGLTADITSAPSPVITSSLTATETYGVAIATYTITATNTPTSFNATGLPAGLSVNTTNGQITGTPTVLPGTYNVTISATNVGGTGSATLVYTINAKGLTVTGASATNKEYDGNTTATISGSTLVGVVGADVVTINTSGTFDTKNVGTVKTVTSTQTLGGADAAKYTVTLPSGLTANITAKALTIASAAAQNKLFDGNTTATITGSLSGVVSPDVVTLTLSGTFASSAVGTGIAVTSTSTIGGADAANYTLTQPSGLTANITIAPTTLAAGDIAVIGYNTNGTPDNFAILVLKDLNAGTVFYINDNEVASAGGTAFSDLAEMEASFTVKAGQSIPAGTVIVLPWGATAVSTTTYDWSSTSGAGLGNNNDEIYIYTAASITATTPTAFIYYAKIGTSSSAIPTGLTLGSTSIAPTGSALRYATTGATYTACKSVLLSAIGNTTTNWNTTGATTIAAGDWTFNVLAVCSTISAPVTLTAFTTTYGTPSAVQTVSVSGSGLTNDISVTAPTGFEVSNGGAYGASTSFTQSGGNASGTLSIRLAATAAVTGTYNNQNITLTSTGATSVNLATTASGNSVSAKALTISVSANNKIYDGNATATLTTPSYVGLENGQTFSVTGTVTASFADKNVGTAKPISLTGTYAAPSTNYTVTQPTLTANIDAKDLTVTGISANNKVYDGTTSATLSAILNGVVAPDNVQLVATGDFDNNYQTITIAMPATIVSSSFTLTGTAGDITNYNLIQPTVGTLTADITPKALTISNPTAANKTFDGTTNAVITGTLVGVVLGDSVNLDLSTGVFASANVGTNIVVTPTWILDGDTYNYTLTEPSVTLTANITTPGSPNITSSLTASATYGDTSTLYSITTDIAASSYGATGLPGGLSINTATGEITGAPTTAGTFNVSLSATGFGGSGFATLVYTIAPKTLTVPGATANNKVYDGNTSATISGTLVGVINSDDVTFNGVGTFDSFAVANSIAVTSNATLTGANASNYTLTQPTGLAANITPKPLSVTFSVTDKVYDKTNTATVTSPILTGVVGLDTVTVPTFSGTFNTVTAGNSKPVSVAGITLGGANAGNYSIPATATTSGNITPKPLTVTASANNKQFDGTNVATITVSAITGVVLVPTPDVVTVSGGGTFASTAIGNAISVTPNLVLGGADAANYTLTQPTGLTANITDTIIYVNAFTGVSACPTNGNTPTMIANATGTPVTRNTITCTGTVNVFNSTTLNATAAVNNNSYVEFSATASAGNKLSVTSLSFFRQASNTAPNQLEVRYSTDGFATSSSWGSAPNSPTAGTVITWDFTDFTTPTAGMVTFRLYPYGTARADGTATAASTSGTFRVDDVTIYGKVLTGPTAAALSLTGSTTFCSGLSSTIKVDITGGTAPYSVTYTNGSSATATAYVSGSDITVTPSTSSTYTLVSVTDANGITLTSNLTGSAAFTVTPTVGTPSIPTPSATTICQGSASTTYTTSATNATSYIWSVTGTGNTISGTGATGTVTWASGFSGSATVTVVANGCNGPSALASTMVTLTPTVGTPSTPTPSTNTICQGSLPTTYTTSTSNASSYTWSVTGAGNSISGTGATGTVTWSPGFSGSATVSVVANGCNGPSASASTTVTVNPQPIVTASNVSGCSGSAITLVGSPAGGTYSVANPFVGTSSTTYTYSYTAPNGCSATSTPANITITAQPLWYLDADGDGYYTGAAVPSCTSPGAGYTTTVIGGNDCTDTGSVNGVAANLINPGRPEICYNNVDDNCSTTLSEGCAPVVVNMTSTTLTLASFSTPTVAVPYTFAPYTNLKYRFEIKKIVAGNVVETQEYTETSRFGYIPGSMRSYGVTYEVRAAAVINDEVLAYLGNTMVVTAPTLQTVTLSTASCGLTLPSLNTTISADAGLNAINYKFRIRLDAPGSTPTEQFSATRFINTGSFAGFPLQFATSYKVAVSFTYADPANPTGPVLDSGYGTECTITTLPVASLPTIGLVAPVCNLPFTQLTSTSANITAAPALGATGYQFELRLPNATTAFATTAVLPSRFGNMGAFGTLPFNTQYEIRVRYSILVNGVTQFSNYGPVCNVKTPLFPLTSLTLASCSGNKQLNETLNIIPYPGFPNYRVKIEKQGEGEGVELVSTRVIPYSYFKLNEFPGVVSGTDYFITVEIVLAGATPETNYGSTCGITTNVARFAPVPFKATAYPNPFANNFMLDVKTASQSIVNVKVYDMVGRLIEQRAVRTSDLETTTIGDRYPSGVYNVTVTQGEETRTVRVVKR